MTGEITGEARNAPDWTWVIGGGIELPCVYYITKARNAKPKRGRNTEVAAFIVGDYKKSARMENCRIVASRLLCYHTPKHCGRTVVL